jgi:TolB protein
LARRGWFDWVVALLSAGLVAGLYLDIWAHAHGRVDNTFFTPWHAVLYSTMVVVGAFLGAHHVRFVRQGYHWRTALPAGYGLSLLGVGVFAAGGAGDLAWHTVFGVEVDLEQLLSPSHLLLALGGVLIVSGPARAAWHAGRLPGGGVVPAPTRQLPMVLSLALVLSIITAMTQFVHPVVDAWAERLPTAAGSALEPELFVMRSDGSLQTRLAFGAEAAFADPAWSPDGRVIAFTRWMAPEVEASRNDAAHRTGDILVMAADGSGLSRLTDDPRSDAGPVWSPDGRAIAFHSNRAGRWDIFVMAADGSKQTRLTTDAGDDVLGGWSPDGQHLTFSSNRDGNWEVYAMRADGSSQTRLTRHPADDFVPSWSPDGRRIAFSSRRDGRLDIYTMAADGGGPVRMTTGGSSWAPTWSPDGRRLAFYAERDGDQEIYTVDATSGAETNLTRNPAKDDGLGRLSWSPDGEAIVYMSRGRQAAHLTPFVRESLGAAGILLQAGLLVAVVLLALRQPGEYALPFGALTLILVLNTGLMAVVRDQYRFLPAALVTGLAADLLARWLRPAAARPVTLRVFASAVPALFYGLYFLTLQLTGGIGWSAPLWSGAIALAGGLGLLLSLLVVSPRAAPTSSISV